MGTRLTVEQKKRIDELYEQRYEPPEIGREVHKDTRTVKTYLNERPRQQSLELQRQLDEIDHRKDVRRRIARLKRKLEFPDPLCIWVRNDTETGEPATRLSLSLRGDVLEWELKNSAYVIKLGKEFDPVMGHLRSSRRVAVLQQLEKWRRLAGKCVKRCYELRRYIEEETQEQTNLAIVPDCGQRGLLDGFGMSVYWATFSSRGSCEHKYEKVSEMGNVHLLRYASSYNLAWVRADEVSRIKDWHERLTQRCRDSPKRVEINEAVVELKVLTKSLQGGLDDFAGLKVLSGRCARCPSA